MMPIRIQRKRTKGGKMPAGAVYVGRPSRWRNSYRVDGKGSIFLPVPDDAAMAVKWFRETLLKVLDHNPDTLASLRGKNLACWCPLSKPCHADVLLELANAPPSTTDNMDGK